jgi:tetratricopeptide (TPR) repeat protein
MSPRIVLIGALLLTIAIPVFGQSSSGKLHGRVLDPAGIPKTSGTVALSVDGGYNSRYTFPVDANGEYSGGGIEPGTYSLVYRAKNSVSDKYVDLIKNVKIVAGEETVQNIDMSRKEYIDTMSPEQRKQLQEFKEKNVGTMLQGQTSKGLNADLVAARAANKAEKFAEAEAMMLNDTKAYPEAVLLWVELGLAQLGLKKYPEAELSFQKALAIDPASRTGGHREDYYAEEGRTHASRNTAEHTTIAEKKLTPDVQAVSYASLGEVYIRTGKVADAQAAYDTAAKLFPPQAAFYYGNEAVYFSQVGNTEAQLAAANKAIAADATRPVPYYLKGQALVAQATMDAKTQKLILPPGCLEAYQKYVALDPNGKFVNEAKAIIAAATEQPKPGKS